MNRFSMLLRSFALAGALVAAPQGVGVSWAADATFKKAPMSDDPSDLYAQGAVLASTNKLDAAEKLAKAALKNHPEAHGFHLLLGDVEYRRKRHAEAFYEWQWEFLRAGPGSGTGDIAAKRIGALLSTARGVEVDEARLVIDAVMLTPKDPKAAFTKLERVQRERGSRFALREFMAEALQGQGALDEAASLYRELLREDPYFVPGYVQLAMVLKAQGNEKEALEVMKKAVAMDPDNWRLKSL